VKNAIRVAVEAVEHKINPRIEEAMSTISTAAPVSEI
jgi:hypothetical protein